MVVDFYYHIISLFWLRFVIFMLVSINPRSKYDWDDVNDGLSVGIICRLYLWACALFYWTRHLHRCRLQISPSFVCSAFKSPAITYLFGFQSLNFSKLSASLFVNAFFVTFLRNAYRHLLYIDFVMLMLLDNCVLQHFVVDGVWLSEYFDHTHMALLPPVALLPRLSFRMILLFSSLMLCAVLWSFVSDTSAMSMLLVFRKY